MSMCNECTIGSDRIIVRRNTYMGDDRKTKNQQTIMVNSMVLLDHPSSAESKTDIMAAAPSKIEALALFRSLLQTARQFSDYNIREYAKLDGFRANRSLTDSNTITSAYVDGKNHLEIAKRQAVVYSLYALKVKSIMEIQH
ncbi:hypothetical protein ACFE04_006901 [Oxalis oulophora]